MLVFVVVWIACSFPPEGAVSDHVRRYCSTATTRMQVFPEPGFPFHRLYPFLRPFLFSFRFALSVPFLVLMRRSCRYGHCRRRYNKWRTDQAVNAPINSPFSGSLWLHSEPSVVWVLPRRRLGGVTSRQSSVIICVVAVFLFALLFSFVFCVGYGRDDDGAGTTHCRRNRCAVKSHGARAVGQCSFSYGRIIRNPI